MMELHYCIMQVDDRCSSNVENTKRVMDLVGARFIDRKYFSWKKRDPHKFLASRGIRTDNWLEASHKGLPPLIGELGHLSSIVDLLDDLSSRDVEHVLVFEDDCIINENFPELVQRAMSYEFDIFHFSYLYDQWQIDGRVGDIIDDFSVRAHFKRGLMYSTLYSKSGINRVLKTLERIGAIGAIDLSIDEYGRRGCIDCLCVNPENISSLQTVESMSTIDPLNMRHDVASPVSEFDLTQVLGNSKTAVIQMLHSRPHTLSHTIDQLDVQSYKDFDFYAIANKSENLPLFRESFETEQLPSKLLIDNTIGNTTCYSRWAFSYFLSQNGYERFIFIDDDVSVNGDFVSTCIEWEEEKVFRSWFAWVDSENFPERDRVYETSKDCSYAGCGGGAVFGKWLFDLDDILQMPGVFHNLDDIWVSCVLNRYNVPMRFLPVDIGFFEGEEESEVALHKILSSERPLATKRAYRANGLTWPHRPEFYRYFVR